jgi:membrane protein
MDYREQVADGAGADRSSADLASPRAADQPAGSATSARSWSDILLAVAKGISADRIFLIAAGVTFYAILALFPGIGAIVSIYGLFADPGTIASHLDTLAGVAPSGAVDVIRTQLTHLAGQNGTALGIGFAISLAIALWFSNSGMTGLFDALNVVYEKTEQRSLLKYYATTLTFTLGAIVLVLVSIAIIVAIPVVLHFIPYASLTSILLDLSRWPLLFVLVVGALVVLYRYAPCRKSRQWRWIIGSSVFAAAVWLAVSALFSWYVGNFGSYNKTYGSLGAIFGFMTWMWLSMVVVLVGAKLDAELERPAPDAAPKASDGPATKLPAPTNSAAP